MKWEMEIEEIEAVLEKIWDLHDKLSDAIHSISRTHFLNSIKSLRKSDSDLFVHRTSADKKKISVSFPDSDDHHRAGFVFIKDFRVDDDDATVQEAKSLNAIRTALENLEDHLEFFHTVQTQQRVERDAAIARLEQSRNLLAMRLAEHQGKKYKVIEEAEALVGDVCNVAHFVMPEDLCRTAASQSAENRESHEVKRSNILIKFLISSLKFAKGSLKLDQMGGILGNAALVAVSMLAFLHMNQVSCKDKFILDPSSRIQEEDGPLNRTVPKVSRPGDQSGQLDVLLARG